MSKHRALRLLLAFAAFSVLFLCFALSQALFFSPIDILHGVYVRILYVHVPFAYSASLVYVILSGCCLWSLIRPRSVKADLVALALAPVGCWLTVLTLVTGSLWGRQAWGVWWVWDARLTSVLVLLFIYLGYLGIRWGSKNGEKSRTPGAIFVMIGLINIPIVKFSVQWWNTVHQPSSIFNKGNIAIHPALLQPLIFMALAFTFLVLLWVMLRYLRLKEAVALENVSLDLMIQKHNEVG